MTKEEAIDQLKFMLEIKPKEPPEGCDYIEEWLDTDKEIRNALEMAIEALKQAPCKDSISREAVFETIDDCNSDGLKGIFCSYVDGEKFKKYIKELPSVIPKGVTVTDFADKCRECGKMRNGKWILVSERLPENGELVLFSTKTGRIFEGGFYDDKTDLQWYAFRNREFVCNNVVTAWQPLPEPYQEEKE